jgi:hypothetical protein
LKNKKHKKKDWGMAQVVECLPSKGEVLSSNPNIFSSEKVTLKSL